MVSSAATTGAQQDFNEQKRLYFKKIEEKYDVDETILHRGAAVAAQFAADYLAETAQQ